MQQIVAIEGIVHAGKSTLIENLKKICHSNQYQFVSEYGEFIGGGQNFPGFPKNSLETIESDLFFEKLEQKRFQTINNRFVAILDRSLLSVLAYHYATEKITRNKIECFQRSMQFFKKNHENWFPDVCFYLEISLNEQEARHDNNGYYESVLLDKNFNTYLIEFYEIMSGMFPKTSFYPVDAQKKKTDVIRQVLTIIK